MNQVLELSMDELERVGAGANVGWQVTNAHTDKGVLSVITKTDHDTGVTTSTARWYPD